MTYALARSPATVDAATSFAARDEFTQDVTATTGSPLDTLVLPIGGSWDTSPSTGTFDPTDFTVFEDGANPNTAQRAEISDASVLAGRYAAAGVTLTSSVVTMDAKYVSRVGGSGQGFYQGVLARYSDPNNWVLLVAASLYSASGFWQNELILYKRVGGTVKTLDSDINFSPLAAADIYFTLQLQVSAAGIVTAWGYPQGSSPGVALSGALGAGELTSGKPGFYDAKVGSTAVTRVYTNFSAASIPVVPNAALHASRSMRFTHEAIYRDSSDGTSEGRVPIPEGKYPTVLPATRSGRKSRLVVKGRRFDQKSGLPDLGIADSLVGDMTVTPRIDCLSGTDVTPGGFPTYLVSGHTVSRSFDANTATIEQIADVLATAILEHASATLGTYTFPNSTGRRTLDAQSAPPEQIADFVATLITDLTTVGPAPGGYTATNYTLTRLFNATTATPFSLANVAATWALDLQNASEL